MAYLNANSVEECKGHLLLDDLQLEMKGRDVVVIAIIECGATIATGCIGAYYTDAPLQSAHSSGHGCGIALLIHPA